ncbi:MAG TPA: 2'-5' RNA ligase family protein [Chthoniobacterales bacterium]|nr:2'-5' RNA ligase family protein [Chthoniobacterales bacterium]
MSAQSQRQILTYWLMPAEPTRSHFVMLIADFAERFDAPVFEPHVTLFAAGAETDNAADLLVRAVAGANFCHPRVAGIGHSEEFTKTLFIQFDPDEGVAALNARFNAASNSHDKYEIDPHLSLLYKELPVAEKAALAAELSLPFREVTFESVKAVLSPADIRSRREVEAWQVIAEAKLQ